MKIIVTTAALFASLSMSACETKGACEWPANQTLPPHCDEIFQRSCKSHRASETPKFLGGSCASHGYTQECPGATYLKCR